MSNESKKPTSRSSEQQGFDQISKITHAKTTQAVANKIFKASPDWVIKHEPAYINQEPTGARRLLYIVVLVFIALIVWANWAELDEITRGDGRIIPSQQLQIIQSLDGGIVQDILVREGQTVERGDPLVIIDATRSTASFRENRAQVASLSAEIERLQALIERRPPEFDPAIRAEHPVIFIQELALYQSARQELAEQLEIARSQLAQRREELKEAEMARTQQQEVLSTTRRELNFTRPLLRSGAVSEVDVIRLERDLANAQGELNRTEVTIRRLNLAIEEAEIRIKEIESVAVTRWRTQLSESVGRLATLSEAEAGLEDRVRQTELRSPVRGTIQRLYVNTVGGVVSPGREVMEIVPLDDTLIVEARIAPRDIANIRPGLNARLKFTAYDFMIYGAFDAKVAHISADTITDEKDETYYLVRLQTDDSLIPANMVLIPGMTVQVDILTGKKSVLDYLLKPVLRATSNAMTER
ncbi:secretion protein HylD [Thiomicrospira aerophila AL3]|uniref:Membrane fusion protein (MFP) family protein n=1 Tax=Thiomicrospira aerophila AL3 TaxID=717772 RepID=W0DTP1_9GAMM|nr:HlyD family type I secretion periplasmic adaptor subunit [Thiomicrospira aerophila]AHF00364.1 secretion protein HylD [Thiomicrospira aerophila AL3]